MIKKILMITREKKERSNEDLLYIGIWTLILSIPVLPELFNLAQGKGFDWWYVIRWWMGSIPFLIIFIIHNNFLIPHLFFKNKVKSYICSVILLVILFGVYKYVALGEDRRPPRPHIEHIAPPEFKGHRLHPRNDFNKPRIPMPVLINLILGTLLLATNTSTALIFKHHREQAAMARLEAAKAQDELRYLKTQINPHFFMNMLNNIHAMIDINPSIAQEMILELSKLMRYVLYEGDQHTAPLDKEINFISNYLSLMRQRYSETKVEINFSAPEKVPERIKVPPLIFISFIENAFKHGISYLTKSVISIDIDIIEENIRFKCDNTKPHNPGNEHIAKGGVGLENVQKRLRLLYGDYYSLKIDDLQDKYCITLNLPINEKNKMYRN